MNVISENKENVSINFSKKEYYLIQNWLLDLKAKEFKEPLKTTLNNFISLDVEKGLFNEIGIFLKEQ